jgi:ubiquitin C
MSVFVKTITNRNLAFTLEDNMTVMELKQQIESVEGIPIEQMKLIYSGKLLIDNKYLKEYNIVNETVNKTVIHMVLALRGG